ncbi:MAG: lysozyme inhibitor LprI family protein [Devosia sp.]
MRLVAAFVLVLLLLPAAQAASFDCNEATTPSEKAICADPGLSRTDDVMALAYVGAIAGLTEEAEIVMRQGQRDWLDFSDTVCSDANLPGENAAAIERPACLHRLYDERLKVLEQSRMVNGMRFFTVDSYEALPDPNGGRFKLGLKVVSSLRMDGNDSRAEAFNAYMRQVTEDYTGQFTDFAGTTMDDSVPYEDDAFLMTLDSSNASRVSIGLEIEWYGHGAAHANRSRANFHFLTQAERPLVAGDIFAGKGWSTALAGLVAERASVDIRDGQITYDAADMIDIATDPKRWSFTKAGLMVQFQDQEITPGGPVVSVGWGPLRDHLAGGADVIARY